MLTKKAQKGEKTENGISLRSIQVVLIIGAVVISGLMLFSTFRLYDSFQKLTTVSKQQIQMRDAARELMDASDYLTEQAQRFVLTGDQKYEQLYFKEALELKHRNEAIEIMKSNGSSKTALEDLQSALAQSNELMQTEYYSMRLVIEAKGYTDYPSELKDIKLSAADKALDSEAKIQRATDLVFGDDYYIKKDQIRQDMKACLIALEQLIYSANNKALSVTKERLILVRVMIAIGAFSVLFLVWLASRLGIHPILNAVERIKTDKKIKEEGTSEFRYLVRAYNKMYEGYRKSIEYLNFKASHDELTGVYNRAGYESLRENIDLKSTYMLLFDVDNFKSINDDYGHDTGDAVLIKLVNVLHKHFRPDDFICRIGGDEFVVFMQHSPEKQEKLIAQKIEDINKALGETDDNLPPASISVGIVHGSEAEKVEELFEKTDEAMYRAKQNGKQTYSFY